MKKLVLFFLFVSLCQIHAAQLIHSHNDYQQKVPFWEAFAHGVGSIEVDLFLRNGKEIVVCHDDSEVAQAPLFEELYIRPLAGLKPPAKEFILLIDLKTPAQQIMNTLVKMLEKYPHVFHKDRINVVISGSRPPKESWSRYPDYIWFDGQLSEQYTANELSKVYMMSDAMGSFTDWNGKGMIPPAELDKVNQAISSAHVLNKPIRFWGVADCPNAWLTLSKLGVDVINTDKIAACTAFFQALDKGSYTLQTPQTVYTPTYQSDGKKGIPQNVILIIGDGMSINQITATEIANRGRLSLLQMRNIGFIKTWALNNNNPDSAGAGSAMATGQKTNNRHISTSPDGAILLNASEVFSTIGKKIGVVSSGDITDATPAAQYGHSVERNNSEEIALWLNEGKVDFLAGANVTPFNKRADGRNLFTELNKKGYSVIHSQDSIALVSGRTLCIDNNMGEWTHESNIGSLAEVTAQAFDKLNNPQGFYLMIESAKIDHAGHGNDMRHAVLETLKLDAVVAESLRFADKEGNTLVIVTGDHETGGMILMDGDRQAGSVVASFTTDDHTGVLLPVFSYGVGSDLFQGTYENTELFSKIKQLIQAR